MPAIAQLRFSPLSQYRPVVWLRLSAMFVPTADDITGIASRFRFSWHCSINASASLPTTVTTYWRPAWRLSYGRPGNRRIVSHGRSASAASLRFPWAAPRRVSIPEARLRFINGDHCTIYFATTAAVPAVGGYRRWLFIGRKKMSWNTYSRSDQTASFVVSVSFRRPFGVSDHLSRRRSRRG